METATIPKPSPHGPAILVREGQGERRYLVISDNRMAIVHMSTAPGGWKFERAEVQDDDHWLGGRDSIVAWQLIIAWRLNADAGRAHIATDLDPTFRAQLLERAGIPQP